MLIAFAKTARELGARLAIPGSALGSIFMIPRASIGTFLWAAIAASDLRYAGFGLVGLFAGHLVGRSLGISDIPAIGGGLRANGLLTAVAVAWLTAPIGLALPTRLSVIVLAAGAASIIAAAIMRLLTATILPSLIWGYCAIAGMMFIIFRTWTSLAASATPAWATPVEASDWVAAFVCSLGSLVFSPTIIGGSIVAGAIVLWSRTLFAAGVIAWIAGALTSVGFQHLGIPYYWLPASYNFFIAGMGLAAVYFLPGRACAAIAAIAGYGAAVFGVVLQQASSAWAFLPVSSAVTIWVGICALALAEEQNLVWRNFLRRVPPEEAWWRVNYWARRIGHREPLLILPLAGAVQISQGFDDALSHRGRWRFALDLQRPAGEGGGSEPSIWGSPVVAPASGFVERVRNDVADNPIGICNYADNWGNYVVIRLDQGGWLLLAHLRQGTIAVAPGMRVDIGTYLGAVGNSGRSPIAHLHLQVQASAEPGARTVPFRVANYQAASPRGDPLPSWIGSAVPTPGSIITNAELCPRVHSTLASMAPGSAIWVAETTGHVPRPFRTAKSVMTDHIDVVLSAAGHHVLKCDGGILVCVADPDAWRVIDYEGAISPLLKLLALAAPAIPYAARSGFSWREPVIVLAGWAARLGVAFAPYRREPFRFVRCRCVSEPGPESGVIAIESELERPHRAMPFKLRCAYDKLRGPTELTAEFARGRLRYSLLSFAPRPPLDGAG